MMYHISMLDVLKLITETVKQDDEKSFHSFIMQ